MTQPTQADLMPLYIVGGLGIIAGVFYVINKNVDKLTAKLDSNKTLEVLSDPVKATEKMAYDVGLSFWDTWDANITEPLIRRNAKPEPTITAQESTEKYPFINEFSVADYLGVSKPAPKSDDDIFFPNR